MNGEIICVGTELLLGGIVNTNAHFLANCLAELGINVYNQSVVGDNSGRIRNELKSAMVRSDIVILTGGLGPTADDITKESVAGYLGLPLVEDIPSRNHIDEYFKRTGRTPVSSNFKQALCPKGAYIFKNDVGTAPGYAMKIGKNTVIILPGPPSEMQPMFNKYVRPYLAAMTNEVIISHNVKIFGEMESLVEEKIKQCTLLSNPTTAPYAKEGEVTLRVTAKADTKEKADELCSPVIERIRYLIGDSVYGVDCENMATAVVGLLKEHNLKIATAESCTAGLLSAMITDIPGASSVFDIGISAYANSVKVNALGVPQSVIDKYGAVSEHTAAYMAMGIRKLAGADIGVGITGVAGPDSSEDKPVGLVYISIADKDGIWVRRAVFGHGSDERDKIRRSSANTALDLVRRYICSLPLVMEGGFHIGEVPHSLDEQPDIAKDEQRIKNLENIAKGLPPIIEAPKKPAAPKQTPNISDTEIASLMDNIVKNDTGEVLQYDIDNKLNLGKDLGTFVTETQDTDDPADNVGYYGDGIVSGTGMVIDSDDDDDTDVPELLPDELNGMVSDTVKPEKTKFSAYMQSVLPWKGDSKKEIIRKSIFIVALVALIVSSIILISYFGESKSQQKIINDVQTLYDADDEAIGKDGVYESFNSLLLRNSDTMGWISIPNTSVNNPIVMTNNNAYYLTHNFLKENSKYGSVFFDMSSVITRDYVSQNLVIYGHDMKDGSMFGSLKKYKNVNFYKENPVISMRTLYDDAKYKIFGIVVTNADAAQDNGYLFEYRYNDFNSQTVFLSWIDQIKERSIINTGVEIEPDDKVITLSTCTSEFTNARLVIFARRIRTGESQTVDSEHISVNTNPHYPQAYYDKRNSKNPYATNSNVFSFYDSSTSAVVSSQSVQSSSSSSSSAATQSFSSAKSSSSKRVQASVRSSVEAYSSEPPSESSLPSSSTPVSSNVSSDVTSSEQ